jgi:phosphohistidine phosphatase
MVSRRIILVRHAQAMTRDRVRWPNDENRPLAPEGMREFERATRGLTLLLDGKGKIVSSPCTRARQTADILRSAWPRGGAPALWKELSPDTSPSLLIHRLEKERVKGDLVLFGHEPHLSRFVGLAVSGEPLSAVKFYKGGAVAIEFAQRPRPGGARILWALSRRQLMMLGKKRRPRKHGGHQD